MLLGIDVSSGAIVAANVGLKATLNSLNQCYKMYSLVLTCELSSTCSCVVMTSYVDGTVFVVGQFVRSGGQIFLFHSPFFLFHCFTQEVISVFVILRAVTFLGPLDWKLRGLVARKMQNFKPPRSSLSSKSQR